MSWPVRLRRARSPRPAAASQVPSAATCPGCGKGLPPDAGACRNCGRPVARPGDTLRRPAPSQSRSPDARPSLKAPALGLVVVALLVVAATLVTSDIWERRQGGRIGAVPVASLADANAARGPVIGWPFPDDIGAPVAESTEPASDQPSPYTCEDREIRDATTSRWHLRRVLAGSRRDFERVTFELTRRGDASRSARVGIEWMSPQQARGTFGLPRFDGRRGLLVTFGRQVTTTGSQVIGPLALRGDGMESISGVYRFVDFDGQVRVFIAIRDRACARIRAPGLGEEAGDTRRATILVDLAAP